MDIAFYFCDSKDVYNLNNVYLTNQLGAIYEVIKSTVEMTSMTANFLFHVQLPRHLVSLELEEIRFKCESGEKILYFSCRTTIQLPSDARAH